jgi:glycosyltransferase involved in cell wall biosynthesis
MRILFCVQRYGDGVAGGSETACREVAERLAARGHDVHVLTSRAKSYVDWADHFPEGTSELGGVTVHRLSVRDLRRHEQFAPLHRRMITHPRAPLFVQRDWLRVQGPDLPGLVPWLEAHTAEFDAAVFFTYLYPTTGFGLPVAAKHCPTVLVPTAHDEPMLQFRVFDQPVQDAGGIICLTPEELELIERRFHPAAEAAVIGLGVEPGAAGDPDRFRERFGLGDRPYLLFLGRVDPGKGSDELVRLFRAYRDRRSADLALVVVGEPVTRPEPDPDIVVTGYVDEQTKHDALAGATVLVQPSYFESFSLALCEGWLAGKPAIVQGRCEVLAGQCARSGAGLPYRSFAEFATTLDRLLGDHDLCQAMGDAGRRYVLDQYSWERVIEQYEAFIGRVAQSRSATAMADPSR